MTFYEMIDSKVMPEIRKGSTDEFIVYRDTERGWQCDFTENQYGETFDWVAEVKSADPFAEIFSGASLQSISGDNVAVKVLAERLYDEYAEFSMNYENIADFLSVFPEKAHLLPPETLEYIANLDYPLEWINSLHIPSILELIEQKTAGILAEQKNSLTVSPENHVADNYTILQEFKLGNKSLILSERKNAADAYTISKYDKSGSRGANTPVWKEDGNDYIKILERYCEITKNIVKEYFVPQNIDFSVFTAADCITDALNEDFERKIIVIKPETLAPEQRRDTNQLKLCLGGTGSQSDIYGDNVFCIDLYSGKESACSLNDIAGVIDPAKLPEWAKPRLLLTEKPGYSEYLKYRSYDIVREYDNLIETGDFALVGALLAANVRRIGNIELEMFLNSAIRKDEKLQNNYQNTVSYISCLNPELLKRLQPENVLLNMAQRQKGTVANKMIELLPNLAKKTSLLSRCYYTYDIDSAKFLIDHGVNADNWCNKQRLINERLGSLISNKENAFLSELENYSEQLRTTIVPDIESKPRKTKLLGQLDKNLAKVEKAKAEQKDRPATKKRNVMEVE